MRNPDSLASIHSRLQTFAGKRRSWGELTYLLLQVEESGEWQNSAGTFTDWVSTVGQVLGLQESNIWRYLASGRYALRLHGVTLGQLPEAEIVKLLNQASPESLELLSKVSRVAPDAVVQALSAQVLAGEISRAKLRDAWQAFRPALKGQTAQGLRKAVPKVDLRDPEQQESVLQGTVLATLMSSDTSWLGTGAPQACAWFRDVAPKHLPDKHTRLVFDAVAATQQNETADLELHVFQIRSRVASSKELEHVVGYCDYLWIASTQRIEATALPAWLGILEVDNGQVVVARRAQKLESNRTLAFLLVEALLLRSLKR